MGLTKSRVPVRRARAAELVASIKRNFSAHAMREGATLRAMEVLFDELTRVAGEMPSEKS
jgi:hypothetical protein